jgi:UDP-N-acetylmuramoyl-tripeptide--D-alanyl-D-alanine ligase
MLVAQSGVYQLMTFGLLAQYIAQGTQHTGIAAACIHMTTQPEDAVTRLRSLLRPGDVILLKASRGMAMERLVDTLAEQQGGG